MTLSAKSIYETCLLTRPAFLRRSLLYARKGAVAQTWHGEGRAPSPVDGCMRVRALKAQVLLHDLAPEQGMARGRARGRVTGRTKLGAVLECTRGREGARVLAAGPPYGHRNDVCT